MMPLIYADQDDALVIKRVNGREEVVRHLEELGFVPGAYVKVVSQVSGNIIVNIKDSRIAVSKEMASRVMV